MNDERQGIKNNHKSTNIQLFFPFFWSISDPFLHWQTCFGQLLVENRTQNLHSFTDGEFLHLKHLTQFVISTVHDTRVCMVEQLVFNDVILDMKDDLKQTPSRLPSPVISAGCLVARVPTIPNKYSRDCIKNKQEQYILSNNKQK